MYELVDKEDMIALVEEGPGTQVPKDPKTQVKTAILIVSYLKDRPWLVHCLRSIEKFAYGFSSVHLHVPTQEEKEFSELADRFGAELTTYRRDGDMTKWQLHAQAQKCIADRICPFADLVLHMDSDCIFTERVMPEEYLFTPHRSEAFTPPLDPLPSRGEEIRRTSPIMLMEPYANLPGNPWKAVTEKTLKRTVDFEFMRRHPQVNPVGIYRALRRFISEEHGMDFEPFVLAQRADAPWGWTEHNVIGAFAYYHPKWREQYHFVDISKEGRPPDKLMQFYSWGGMESKSDAAGFEGKKCREVIEEILG